MSKKEKDKDKDKDKKKKSKKENLDKIKKVAGAKSKCCCKYKKGENKRCTRCPMFDLIKKAS